MKKTLNELGVVVLFWNDSEKTIKCLKSLLNQQKQKFNIILVDNNSDQIFVIIKFIFLFDYKFIK